MRDTTLWFEGPFQTKNDLIKWTERPEFNLEDDPRWQSIFFPNPDDQINNFKVINPQ